jgi:hypothetical protein
MAPSSYPGARLAQVGPPLWSQAHGVWSRGCPRSFKSGLPLIHATSAVGLLGSGPLSLSLPSHLLSSFSQCANKSLALADSADRPCSCSQKTWLCSGPAPLAQGEGWGQIFESSAAELEPKENPGAACRNAPARPPPRWCTRWSSGQSPAKLLPQNCFCSSTSWLCSRTWRHEP